MGRQASKLWAVVQREYLERVRTRWFVISTVLGPVFFAAMLFLPAWLSMRNSNEGSTATNIVILDATGTGLGERVRVGLRAATTGPGRSPQSAERPTVHVVSPAQVVAAEQRATREVIAKRVQGYLVLDAATVQGSSARYAGRNATSFADTRQIEQAVRQAALAMRLEREGLSPARIDSLTSPRLRLATERLTERGRGGSGAANIGIAVSVSFLLYLAILLYGQNVLRGVMEEKQTRVAEVVLSSVKPEILLAGKVIGVGAVGLTQQLVWLLTTAYIGMWLVPFLGRMESASGAQRAVLPAVSTAASISPGALALILVFFLLGFTFYSSMYAAIGSTVNSEQEAQQALGPILVLVIASSLLIQPVMLNPASGLARAASLIPFSAPIIMPLRMSLVAVPALDFVAAIAGLIAACLAAVWLAARVYRVGLLMYGKRPTLREIIRWVRYAS
jgi:ABC-2 type transport system permease protein